nr:MAG TPA: hypothetical protein [Caudoviricetes sp.]
MSLFCYFFAKILIFSYLLAYFRKNYLNLHDFFL